ncbi:hypothetical protein BCR44DRAFT_1424771 [Catenaria anguillulae PL171]|uniref:Phorbol-ester/DAG-type domain-containing protein n=1 Tax=Catenaria anguillulae PL171 TaxID=765915 RepID=A0A1Y2I0A3_9FUNG|nr:hypothetical protein BCR44DRAFT_1424771 [Catenaria anguillulae PL171]
MLPSSMTSPNLASFLQPARCNADLRSSLHAFRESCNNSSTVRTAEHSRGSTQQPEYSFLQLDAMASELLADTLSTPLSAPAGIPLATALLMEGSQQSRMMLAALAEAVEVSVTNASAILDPISDHLAPGSSHDIALSAQSVLESVRALIHPDSPTRSLPASVPPSSPLAMRHVQREVSVFVQCFTDFATLVYNAVHFATQGEPLEHLTTIASDIRSLYSPFSSRPTSAAGSPRRQQQSTPTPASARPMRSGSMPIASSHPRTPRSATVATPTTHSRIRPSPSLNDTTMGLLNELEDLIEKQEEIRERRRTYLHNKERELLARLSDQPRSSKIQRLSDSLADRVPVPRSHESSPLSATSSFRQRRGNPGHTPVMMTPRTPKAASYGGPAQQQVKGKDPQQRKSAPAMASLVAAGARNPYADMPLLENNKPNRHRFTVTRVDLTDRTEKHCRMCSQGFGFLEKRVVCKDCRLTIHKDCYGTGHPERYACECFNTPEDEEGPEPLWDGSTTQTPAAAHSPFTLMKTRSWSRRNSGRRAEAGAGL